MQLVSTADQQASQLSEPAAQALEALLPLLQRAVYHLRATSAAEAASHLPARGATDTEATCADASSADRPRSLPWQTLSGLGASLVTSSSTLAPRPSRTPPSATPGGAPTAECAFAAGAFRPCVPDASDGYSFPPSPPASRPSTGSTMASRVRRQTSPPPDQQPTLPAYKSLSSSPSSLCSVSCQTDLSQGPAQAFAWFFVILAIGQGGAYLVVDALYRRWLVPMYLQGLPPTTTTAINFGIGSFIFFLTSSLATFTFRSLKWLPTPTARFLLATFPQIYRPCCRLRELRHRAVRVASHDDEEQPAPQAEAVVTTDLELTRRTMRRLGLLFVILVFLASAINFVLPWRPRLACQGVDDCLRASCALQTAANSSESVTCYDAICYRVVADAECLGRAMGARHPGLPADFWCSGEWATAFC